MIQIVPSTSRALSVRSSSVAAATFNHWRVGEENRQQADVTREEIQDRRKFRQEMVANHIEHGKSLSQEQKDQRKRLEEMEKSIRNQNASRGQKVKNDVEKLKEMDALQRAKWVEHGRWLSQQSKVIVCWWCEIEIDSDACPSLCGTCHCFTQS